MYPVDLLLQTHILSLGRYCRRSACQSLRFYVVIRPLPLSPLFFLLLFEYPCGRLGDGITDVASRPSAQPFEVSCNIGSTKIRRSEAAVSFSALFFPAWIEELNPHMLIK